MPGRPLVVLNLDRSVWERVYTVAPLVVVGTREEDGTPDLAPKHMACPLGWDNFFGFVCTPGHATYRNARREGWFTVSYPRPDQVLLATLAAAGRCGPGGTKPQLEKLATFAAQTVPGVLLQDGYLFLECALEQVVEPLGGWSLMVGKIQAARADASGLRTSDLDDHDLIRDDPLLAYLSPGRFACIRESWSFPFPQDFQR